MGVIVGVGLGVRVGVGEGVKVKVGEGVGEGVNRTLAWLSQSSGIIPEGRSTIRCQSGRAEEGEPIFSYVVALQ